MPDLAAIARRLVAPGRDCVLLLPAGPAVEAASVFTYPSAALHWRDQDPPTTLGAADADLVSPAGSVWPGVATERRSRVRRIDTLHGGDPVGVIALAADAVEALRGAATTLATARPTLLFDLRGLDRAARAAIADAAPGYRFAGLDAAWAIAAPDPVAAIAAADPEQVVLDAEAPLAAFGFHPAEDGGRWSGAAPRTWLMLPRPLHPHWRLTLQVADWGRAGGGFPVAIDGAWLTPRRVSQTEASYGRFTIDPLLGPTLRLDLFPPPPAADPVRFPRKLGIRLRRAVLTPA